MKMLIGTRKVVDEISAKPRVLVSTVAHSSVSAWRSAQQLVLDGFSGIELSGGPFDANNVSALESLSRYATLRMHNYFPSYRHPFTFNLASADSVIAEKSVRHATRQINLAGALGHSEVSFHAGYLIDPRPDELGKSIEPRTVVERRKGVDQFVENLALLNGHAEALGVRLLIENNPFTQNHLETFRECPFLFVDTDEIVEVLSYFSRNVYLLLDVGHLKVSARTLGFSAIDALARLNPLAFGYHLNDNDGRSDDNVWFDESAWFWNLLDPSKDYVSIEVVDPALGKLSKMWELCLQKFSNGVER